MFYISGLLKILQNFTVFFSIHICNHFNHTKIGGKRSHSPEVDFGLFSKVGLVYSRVGDGAGAATNILLGAGAATKI
jgi:hypothetical protein